MKSAIWIAICLMSLLLCGCGGKRNTGTDVPDDDAQTVNFINGVRDADVWILPDTEANRKTTLWGTATAAKVKTGENRPTPLCEPGDDGLYLLRMIDTVGFYYSASGLELKAGWTLRITQDDLHAVTVEVEDENGEPAGTYQAFSARL